jgi:4-carboxymuconolactone decarboxylase
MTEPQRRVADEIASGKRGRIPPPMQAWLRSPELAARAQKLGEFLRYDTVLGPRLSELAILVTARFWTSHYEWHAHRSEALKAGVDPAIIAAIAKRETPVFSDEVARTVYDYATALHSAHLVSDHLHGRAVAELGERGVAELVGLLGYYTLISMTINAFQIDLPEGAIPELEDKS